MIADGLTAQGRADLAKETRRAADRLDQVTTIETNCGFIQDTDDHRLVWTLHYLADMIEGKRRN